MLVYSGSTLDFVGYAASGNAVQTPVAIALSSYPSPAHSHILGPLHFLILTTMNLQQFKIFSVGNGFPRAQYAATYTLSLLDL